ncbi:MAG: tRNA (N(6)-L-threonylcarbamoyladenosine(37)-C(2))-methylthiotransferase MtaB [Rickettsiaceae bacterium]|nr:tRNA (N(6)-L-threonylcarbamoyladenosine(37)-C(2))-methylthiotransferase MtaB [Rickettsiaceae bacterium]
MSSNQVVTFGCRLNIFESQVIKENLDKSGSQNTIVVNTCAVTNEAEKQALQSIRKLKRENPTCNIVVTGCGAQLRPELFANMNEVTKVLGNQEKMQMESYLALNDDSNKIVVNDIMLLKESAIHMVQHFDSKTRAFIEIQNGCNHRCTFCIIPFARGNNRSITVTNIVEQVKSLVLQGFNEVVFTGVDISDYGKDLPGSPTLAQLIKSLLNLVPNLARLRLSSIDVAEIDSELFNLMATEPRLMPHFHISAQAGDDMILKRMKRRHNRTQIIDFCQSLRSLRPEVAFGADIIAGFPTETDEMFANTYKVIEEAGIQFLHVFPYSEKVGTPAARMPQVPQHIRKNRAKALRQEGLKELNKFLHKLVGSRSNMLLEKNNFGHADNFVPTILEQEYVKTNEIIPVEFVSIIGNKLLARSLF